MKKMFVFAAVASLILASCSKNDDAPVYTKLPTELGVSINNIATKSLLTRAAATGETSAFTSGKKVCVFVEGVSAGTYESKVATYTYNGTSWISPLTDPLRIFLTGNKANVYGFYPSDATFDLPTKTMTCAVAASQNFSGAEATDYMYSTGASADVSPAFTKTEVSTESDAKTSAALSFHHALAKVSFVVRKSEFYPAGPSAGVLTKIKMEKATPSATFSTAGTVNVTTGAYASTTLANTLTLTGNVASTEYVGTLPDAKTVTPQAFGLFAPIGDLTGVKVAFTIDGIELAPIALTGAVTSWLPGNRYIYTVTLTPKELKITCAIVNWTDQVQDLGTAQ